MSLSRSTANNTHPLECSGSDDIFVSSTASMSYEPCTKARSRATSRAATPTLPLTPPNPPERLEDDEIDFDIQKRPTMTEDDSPFEPVEKGFLKIRGVQHAPKARPLSGRLTFFEDRKKQTNHATDRAKHNETLHIVKHNLNNSPISELEAAAWAHYHLLVPDVVPTSSRAYYNADGDYVAVSSRVIEGFQSFHIRPLKEADLGNEVIVQTLAECMTASYLFKEDDLHKGNIGVQCDEAGNPLRVVRIDFDMSLWPILKDHKQSSATDYTLRKLDTSHYHFTENDIAKFPNLENCRPFYWPSRTLMFPDTVTTIFSANAYTANDAEFFRKLKNNPVFKFHQYLTMLKYALTTPEMYRNEIKEHVREDLLHINGRSLIDVLVDYQAHEIESMKAHLLTMPEFGKLFYKNGKNFLNQMLADFEKRNSQIDLKIETAKTPERKATLAQLKIDLNRFRERFNQFSKTRNYNAVTANSPLQLKK